MINMVITFLGQSDYAYLAMQFNNTFIVSQSPFPLAVTYGHLHVTSNGGFLTSPMPQYVSKGE